MGIYYSRYPRRCPRCEEEAVWGVFISANTPMTYDVKCLACRQDDFTKEEIEGLGEPYGVLADGTPLSGP